MNAALTSTFGVLVKSCGPQILHLPVDLNRPHVPSRHGNGRRARATTIRAMSSRRPSLLCTVRCLLRDLMALVRLGLTSRAQLAAENLFLRKQVALYQERRTKPRRPDPATRVALMLLSQWLDWRSLLTVVRPDTIGFSCTCFVPASRDLSDSGGFERDDLPLSVDRSSVAGVRLPPPPNR